MIKIIDAKGTPEEIGLAIGRGARVLVQKQVALYKEHWKKLTHISWEEGLRLSREFEKPAREALPDVFAELAGIAAGANVSARELFMLNAFEEVDALSFLQKKKHEKCTSVAVSGAHMKDGRSRIIHNEDWMWFDSDLVYAVRVRPQKGTAFLSITYGGLLPNYGVNEHGVAQVCDSLAAKDERVGVPRLFVARKALESKSITQALTTIKGLKRSGGYNHLLMDAKGHAVNFETSATSTAMLPVHGFSVHTNFYQDPKLAKGELHTRTHSRYRYYRVKDILSTLIKKHHDLTQDDLFGVLSDHENYPESVCQHRSDRSDSTDQTIASYVIDPARQSIILKQGNPCGKTTKQPVPAALYFLDEARELNK